MKLNLGFKTLAKSVLALLGLLLAASSTNAQTTYQWNGATDLTSTNWSTSTNWAAPGIGPTNGTFNARLNVSNTGKSPLAYTAVQGTTVYNMSNNRGLVIGSGTAVSGAFIILGGTFSTTAANGADVIGNGAGSSGTLIVNGGNFIGSALGTGMGIGGGPASTFTITNGGTATVATLNYNTTRGTLSLEQGGTLAARAITYTAGACTNNFNGGTLQARTNSTSFLANSAMVSNVRNLGAIVDTAGFNITIGDALEHSVIAGDAATDGGLTKIGNGTLTLTGTNTYTGPTRVNAGTLVESLPVSSSGLTVAAGTKYSAGVTNAVWPMDSAALTNSTLEFNYGSWTVNGYTNAVMQVTNLAISGSVTCNIAGTGFPVTNLTLLSYGAKTGGGAFVLGTLPAGAAATLNDDGANVTLNITAGSIQNLIWSGGSDLTWQTNGGANWNGNTTAYLEYPSGINDVVTFNDTSSGSVTISNQVNPSGITVDVTANIYTFNGPGSIIGTNGLAKLGTSTLTINNSNAVSGTVTISGGSGTTGGTLYVNNPDALGSTNGGTIVSGPANTLEIGTFLGVGVGVTNKTVTINGTGVGGARGALRGAQVSSGENVWAGPVIIGTELSRIGTEDGGNLTVAGLISDNGANFGALFRPGANGVVTVSGSGSSYAYTRTFGDAGGTGIVKIGANNALSTNRLDLGIGYVDLNGFNQTFGGINDVSGPGRIVNNGGGASTLTLNTSTNNFSSLGDIQDGSSSVTLVKLGTGGQTLAGTNLTYTGTTTVSGGLLSLITPNPMASSITVASGATLSGEPTTTGSLTLSGNSTLIVNPVTPGSLAANTIDASTSPVTVSFSAAPATNAPTLVLAASGGITGSAANFQAVGVRGGTFFLTNANTELMFVPAAGAAIVWKGNDATNPTFWDVTTTTNWANGVNPDLFFTGDEVLFNDTATSYTVAVQGSSVAPASVTFNNSVSNYVVSGGGISGGAPVTKIGTGSVTLAGNNSYTGITTVSNGTIIVQNNNALGAKSAGTVVTSGGSVDLGGSLAANALNLGTEVLTISGNGAGGDGAVINTSANGQINAVQQMALAGNASVGGPGVSVASGVFTSGGAGRWDMRGTGNTLDLAGNTLTKTGSNYVALVNTVVTNPGNIVINSGVLGIQVAANLNGSSANTLTVNDGGVLEFFQMTNSPTWSLVLNSNAAIWAESSSATGTNLWAGPVTLNGSTLLQADAVFTLAGNISGAGSFTKAGGSTTTLAGDNTYSGGTTITNGVILAGTNTALGTGPVTINPSATRLVVADGQTITNAIVINGGGASFRGLIENSGPGNATLAGSPITINGLPAAGGHFASTGGGTLTVSNPINASVTVSFRTGSGIFSGGGSYSNFQLTGSVKLGANNGISSSASLDLGSASGAATFDLAGFNQSLTGITRVQPQAAVITNSSTSADATLTITGTSSYPGLINDSGVALSRVALVVNGGNLTLSGANSYSGGSTVTNGTLRINTTTAAGTGTVTVQNGGILTGNGTVSGATTTDAGSTLSPGTNGVGTLTFSAGLTIGGNVFVELDKSLVQSNDVANVTGSLANVGSGTLIVSNLGPALVAGDSFTLFNQPVVNGNLLTIAGPAGVTFTNDLVNSGSISVLSVVSPPTIPTTPTNITFSVTSSNITIGWPSNYTGWTLQSQTNLRSVGLRTNWFDLAGSELTNTVTLPVNKADPTVFFRLIYTNAP